MLRLVPGTEGMLVAGKNDRRDSCEYPWGNRALSGDLERWGRSAALSRGFLPPPLKSMPRVPRLIAAEAEAMLLPAGFDWLRRSDDPSLHVRGW